MQSRRRPTLGVCALAAFALGVADASLARGEEPPIPSINTVVETYGAPNASRSNAMVDYFVSGLAGALQGGYPADGKFDDTKPEFVFVPQYRHLLARELAFIRLTCDLPKDQRVKIKQAGEAALHAASKRRFDRQQVQGRGFRVRVLQGEDAKDESPTKIIRAGLEAAVRKSLTGAPLEQYTQEARQREARARRAAKLMFVSRLDDALHLSVDQRRQIEASLDAHWQAGWEEEWPLLLQFAETYFPQIPDEIVEGCLRKDQKSIWRSLEKAGLDLDDLDQLPAQGQNDGGNVDEAWWNG